MGIEMHVLRKPTPSEVRALLARHGLTQAKAAALIGRTGARTVNRWCSDRDHRGIPVDTAVRLWAACGEQWTGGGQ